MDDYAEKIRKLEEEGLTTSDALAVIEAEEINWPLSAFARPGDVLEMRRAMTTKQIVKQYPGEFNAGKYRAGRIHIYSSLREIVEQCRKSIAAHHRRDPQVRLARKAYYLVDGCQYDEAIIKRDALHLVVSALAAKADISNEKLVDLLRQAEEELRAKRWLT